MKQGQQTFGNGCQYFRLCEPQYIQFGLCKLMNLMRVAMFRQLLKFIFAEAGGRQDLAYSP